jgi:hypothetical protein
LVTRGWPTPTIQSGLGTITEEVSVLRTPAYRRIVNDIKGQIDAGVLAYGDRLSLILQLQHR